ncbi:hypothetical protein [Bergeyella sp. RCAD1439]|uniref:hypothetical protein n=1 Tax=Bergeyella anatis TaxID=3113737 RepID=UPI002E18B95B|nr:hypothetical protein [Bergeyella sp. RCAD1439]
MQTNHSQGGGIGEILTQAFRYWSRTLFYQLFFTLIYGSILLLVVLYFSERLGIMAQYEALSLKMKQGMEAYMEGVKVLSKDPNYIRFNWIVLGTMVFLHPLNMGLLKIYRKMDEGERPELADLFAGYSGANFFIYLGFYLLWFMVYTNVLPTLFLGGLWVLATLFCAPLMFFMDKRLLEALKLSYKGVVRFPLEVLVCSFVAFAFKYFGVMTLVGGLFTFPFWNAVIYALYRKIYNEVR